MTRRIACAALLACPLVVGCGGLFNLANRNLHNEVKLIHDEHMERFHYACLARDAWEAVRSNCPGRTFSVDYAAGFKTGFADYLYAGGCGEPPGMPPKCYRHYHAESAKGVAALQDWYAGFRHGAAAAKESGLRQFVVVSLPPPPGAPPVPPPVPLADVPNGVAAPPSSAPSLPTPRRAPAEVPPAVKEVAPRTDYNKSSQMLPGSESVAPPEENQAPEEPTKEGPAIEGSTTEQPEREEPS